MPRLTGEELSKLYPKAKTYDELQAKHEKIKEIRRPKFVALKIASLTTLIAAAGLGVYATILWLLPSFESGSTGTTMFGVCVALLSAVFGIAAAYYLYSLIDGIASKVFINTTPLYVTLALMLCVCGGVSSLLLAMEFSVLGVVPFVIPTAFMLSFMAVILCRRFNT